MEKHEKMIHIQGGTFIMGSPADEPEREDGEIQHEVTLSSFQMGKYPVTQDEYLAVMGDNPSTFKGDNLPVEQVTWYNAIAYCNRLSVKEGLLPAYRINGSTNPDDWGALPEDEDDEWDAVEIASGSTGYRLPTEGQWEYACRAGTTTAFNTGMNITTDQANYDGNCPYNDNPEGEYREKTTLVGSFTPNAWGLYDMHGNVYEWCWDWYGAYSTANQSDPLGASSISRHVKRGGSWISDGQLVRSAYRSSNTPSHRNDYLGFRLVLPQSLRLPNKLLLNVIIRGKVFTF